MREKILRMKTQEIYRFVQAALLFSILLFGAGEFWGAGDAGALHFLMAFAVFGAAFGMRRLTGKGRLFVFFLFLVLLLITGATLGVRNCLMFLASYGRWLIGTDTWEADWLAGYEVLQAALAAILCYLVQCILEKYFFLKVTLMCAFVCTLLFCLLTGKYIEHAGVVFMLAYIALFAGEWTEHFWEKEKKKDKRAYMFWIMPFMAVYVLFMLWMPAPQKPFSWQFAKDAFSQVQESLTALTQNIMNGKKENFDTALSGFPEDGELQGDLEDERRAIMIVRGEDDLAGNVYLTGRVYDTFDGRQWYQEDRYAADDIFMDAKQTHQAAMSFGEGHVRDFLSLTTLHIRYQYFNTAYVFSPLKTVNIREGNQNLTVICEGGSILFADTHGKADKRGYGTEYEADFYQLNAGSWDFEMFLTQMQEEGRQPDTEETPLSDEVRAYVEEITRYAGSDIEKLRMIESALASYTYTKSPGKLPETVTDAESFLDYFLLESREGYCTYFATAFTLLARAEGFPARYVQGFCVPMEKGGETVVYGDMGHSWPEVYIEGVGWIAFEPTPGYGDLRYTPWETEREREGAEVLSPDGYGEYAQDEMGAADSSLYSTELTKVSEKEAGLRGSGIVGDVLKIALYAALLFMAAGALFIWLERVIQKRRYRKLDTAEKFRMALQNDLRILSWLGLRRMETETLQEFRIRAALGLGIAEDELSFIEKYEALLYGEKSVEEETVAEAGNEGRKLLLLLKEKKKRTYFYYRARVYFY
ncbi:MAG: transglutaminase-like domain-containing protein [Ruminococcus sp.]|nr:transglutaminase-like domain-containing protein [Ruminococcus sp.]